ncbi:MAG: AAA family ATPase [Bacteroidaceae bacterium]|nr:AAA family ATPase [Bacteroidaceae bacterium]
MMENKEMMNAPITNLAQSITTDVPTEKKTVEETEKNEEWEGEGSEEEEVWDNPFEDNELFNPFSDDEPFGEMGSSDSLTLEKPSVTDQFGEKHELRVEMLPLLENPEAELDKMLGCEEIRKQIERLTALTRYNAQLKEVAPDIPPHKVSLHAVFQGAPGTGKTTLCKIYAALLHQAGALSRGHVVVANRSSFIGTRWGDEEVAVAEILKAAKGGVLMIDEAYQLVTRHPNDPGRLILQLMMPMLADEQNRDIAVVLCGYKGLMQELLDQNEGLRSRFVNVFNFPEFSVQQLLEISRRRYSQYQYHFTRQAWMRYRAIIRKGYDQRDKKTWGNARFVANLLDEVYIHHAQRITGNNITDRRQFLTITAADIKPVTLPTSTVPPKIGF